MELASGAPRDPQDSQASLAPQDLLAPLVTQGCFPKVLLIFSARPSAHQAPQGPQECQGSRDPLATKGSLEKSARMAKRVTPAPLDPLVSRAPWGCRVHGAYEDFQGHLDPPGTGVPLGSEGPPGSQEPLGKRATEERGAQRGSAAPRATLAGLVLKASPACLGPVESRACQARTAGMVCQDSMARREKLVATAPRERRGPTGYRVSPDEQGPRVRKENWADLESWARPAPRESLVSLEMLACPASVERLDTGAQRGHWARKAPPGPLASVASRAGRAA